MERRIVLHLDMDAFFASVEQLANPYLAGQPVIVSGDPDGRSVVSTCSYEARRWGVESGMPLRTALRKCPQAIVVQGDPQKYIHISAEVFRILQGYTPFVEPFSIDEAFLELREDSSWEEAERIARLIKLDINNKFHLTCSIGIAKNKLLAKLASGLDKPDGLRIIRDHEIDSLFRVLPIRKLWGVGEKGEEAMKLIGVKTIFDLRKFSSEELVQYFGSVGNYFYQASRGEDDTPLVYYYEEPCVKSIGNEYTLFRDSNDPCKLVGILRFLSQKVSRRLRKSGVKGRTLTVKLRYRGFFTITRSRTLEYPVNSEELIYRKAKGIFFENWEKSRQIRLLGVSVSNLIKYQSFEQELLIHEPMIERKDRITFAKDKVQDTYGEECITWGSVLASKMI